VSPAKDGGRAGGSAATGRVSVLANLRESRFNGRREDAEETSHAEVASG
jgi:hypothetical protein